MSRAPSRRRASIVDVARAAGVSVGTASNVLNRPDAVAPATRARVEAAIEELAFVPNGAARQLRAGTITTVGAILLDIRNPFFTDVARGIEDRLALDDYTLMLASSDDDPDREARYLRLFEEHGVVGVLMVPGSAGTEHLEVAHRRGVRVVLLDAPATITGMSSVAVDDRAGGALAGGHLLDLGHRRITVLNGSPSIRQCRERLAGVRLAVQERGLDPDEVVEEVRIPSLDSAGGDSTMRRLVEERGGPPAAVFCVNDLVAVGVQRALRAAGGTSLLASVAIIGYDDLDIASELAIPLTSVRQPAHDLGFRASDLLLSTHGTSAQHVVFQPELVVRASSVPPR